jgi:protein TonB
LISPLKAGGGAAAAKPKSAQPAKPKPQPKKNVLALAPKQVEPVAPPEQPDPPALDSSTDVNSQVGEPLSDNPGPGSGPGPGPGDGEPSDDGEPRVFEAGMTRPDWQAAAQRDPIVYSREAREAMVEGGMVVKCVVTTAGRLTNCRVIKAQPFMTEAVLSAMSRWQVDPVTLQGRPIAVNYVFNISLKMPGR